MKRKHLSIGKSKRKFRHSAVKAMKKNLSAKPMRGGIRM
jgi:hypothetical protein